MAWLSVMSFLSDGTKFLGISFTAFEKERETAEKQRAIVESITAASALTQVAIPESQRDLSSEN